MCTSHGDGHNYGTMKTWEQCTHACAWCVLVSSLFLSMQVHSQYWRVCSVTHNQDQVMFISADCEFLRAPVVIISFLVFIVFVPFSLASVFVSVYYTWYLCTCEVHSTSFLFFFFLTCHVIVRWCREVVSSRSIRKSSSATHWWSSSQSGCRERYCLLETTAHMRRTCTGEMRGLVSLWDSLLAFWL